MRPLISAISNPFGQSAAAPPIPTTLASAAAAAANQFLLLDFISDLLLGELHDFEQPGGSHSAPNAHRHDDELCAAAPSFDQRVTGETCSRNAVGMPHRDRAAVYVQSFVRNADLVTAVDHLNGKRFI